jgi:K+-sensing histidine kinase KdpD
VSALHGYCGLLADGQLGPVSSEQRELLQRMQCSTRLSRQTTGMLNLIVGGHVKKEPEWKAADIEDALDRAVYEVFPLLQDKEQSITLKITPAEKRFYLDPEQITRAAINMLEDCSKYTPRGGSIEIHGYNVACSLACESAVRNSQPSRNSNAYRIDIQDNGPAIARDSLPALFEQCTDHSGERARPGGGLGFAICKMIVTAHGGFIWAENLAKGASFSMVLPFQPSEVLEAALGREPQAGECQE